MDRSYDVLSGTLSVSEASKLIQQTVNELFFELTIEGEISGFRPASSGHWYFSLKDAAASIDAAVFRSAQYNMERPVNGDFVIARGSLSYYGKTGKLTFVIHSMRKKGEGDLLAAIEKRKLYYKSLGWFDEDRKKPIPEEIKTIGVITSASGAAVRDVLTVTGRRAPSLDVLVFPTAVQGIGAAGKIASRIRQANLFLAADVLIVTRGGGSVEDLSCFSEPEVIEAIHASSIPVVTAIGHEIDWPLADYVSDRRAPTPSAAAELVTETAFRRRERLDNSIFMLESLMGRKADAQEKRLAAILHDLDKYKENVLSLRIPDTREMKRLLVMKSAGAYASLSFAQERIENLFDARLEGGKRRFLLSLSELKSSIGNKTTAAMDTILSLEKDMSHAMDLRLEKARHRLDTLAKESEALSPLSILSRGYAIVSNQYGLIVRESSDARLGEVMSVRLAKGGLKVRVEEKDEF